MFILRFASPSYNFSDPSLKRYVHAIAIVFYNQVLDQFGYTQFERLVDGVGDRSCYLKEFLVCNAGNGLQK